MLPAINIPPEAPATNRGKRFVVNVIWSWVSVLTSLFTGLVLSPYLIRKLGPDGYGVWALSFNLVEYYWFFDLGFRSATVKYVAHYTATGERDKVGEVISTSLLYAGILALLVCVGMAMSVGHIVHFFKIAPTYQDSFAVLLLLITLSWSTGVVFGLFGVSLEAVQRFDITTKIAVAATTLRAIGTVTLLYLGYGLIPIGIAVIGSQFLSYVLNYYYFRHVFSGIRLSARVANSSMLKQLGKFGIHSFLITFSTQLQNQSAPVLIGHFMPAAFVGYYNLPMRLVQYTVDFVGRIGIVTNTNAAELAAKDDSRQLAQLAIYTNRYCLVIFMPLALLLWVDGPQFFVFWVGAKVAAYSAQVLPIILLGYVIAVVGQFSSGMLLLGMGKHQRYARGLVAETVLGFIFLILVIPRYGMIGAAWVVAILMIAVRGIYTSYIASQTIGVSMLSYLHRVYSWPTVAAVPAFFLAWMLKWTVIPGSSWFQIGLLGAILGVVYYAIAVFLCVEPDHRRLLFQELSNRWSRLVSSHD